MTDPKMTGFFLKENDSTIYKAMRTAYKGAGKNDNYAFYKAQWESVEGQYVLESIFEDGSTKLYHVVDGNVELDPQKVVEKVKEQFKKDVAEKRYEIENGWKYCNCTVGTAVVKTTKENRLLVETGATKYQTFPELIDAQFPEGIAVKTGNGDEDVMTIPTAVILDVWKLTSMTIQALYDIETKVIRPQIVADAQEVADGTKTLAEFEATDYVALFESELTTKIADDTIYAQPTTEPV
jgi:hypothetical protein